MHLVPFIKSAGFLGAAAFATVSLSLVAVATQFGPPPELDPVRAAPQQVERTEATTAESPTAATIAPGRRNLIGADPPSTARNAAKPDARPPEPKVVPFGPGPAAEAAAAFVRPGGESPSWLRAGDEDIAASEKLRDRLRAPVEVDFTGLPLREVLKSLLAQNDVRFSLNERELENLSIDPDAPITKSVGELPLCEALELILSPLGLRYEVQPQYVKISTSDELKGVVRYYDLAYVLPTSAGTRDLVTAIESTYYDEGWASDGGESSIAVVGSMMVVNCSEMTHRQIEKMLAELAKLDPQNLRGPGLSNRPTGMMGGMGGGMF